MSAVVGDEGHVYGVDAAENALEIARRRCTDLENVNFQLGDALELRFDDAYFDAVMSSQVFEYLDDVAGAISEMFRVLKPGGRVAIHDSEWGALLWNSSDPDRMARFIAIWDDHLADPHLPRSLGRKLTDAGFKNVRAEPVVHVETSYAPGSVSAVLMKFVVGYVVSQGVSQNEADEWVEDLRALSASGDYFFNHNEYIFTADKL
jgi:SAM-dependent methyltransferase